MGKSTALEDMTIHGDEAQETKSSGDAVNLRKRRRTRLKAHLRVHEYAGGERESCRFISFWMRVIFLYEGDFGYCIRP